MPSRLIQRNLHRDPPLALRGEGIYIQDSNGRTIIDGSGGAARAIDDRAAIRVLDVDALSTQGERRIAVQVTLNETAWHDRVRSRGVGAMVVGGLGRVVRLARRTG